ncbi:MULTISPECIES: flavohemoglobin expression-modulating QEGLA motif protein [Vibrio]|uniref:flavohemoglobin expression-modulating QEGLA motif protein n=1 Tax=Vibrio TaxID=662 RepID=UPI00102DBC2D|nr:MULTISPECIES: flavohemoglobin expression-modulating QEGLA motif protein [Vibrio]MBT0119740.1 flavohemoglobin expression-modulating QEGLA motif protein [Vibrio alginolyticus]MCR9533436.1 flavohemoglobin expression-modulating QEGLA motif protein [Vibrio alginolyticus]MDW2140829.1 flavohemoglobin expression-modulating QEGLA motif protein [Vibrio sp. 1833]MDW2273693.1 flavohemoglobin expression-modulating QEGLA motif protein [Vibrio sp. 1074]MDW2284600.1 flavohemoglobin expression-modulating QE
MTQLNDAISDQLLAIDENLTQLVADIDILSSVNPLNYAQERERFIKNKYSQEPSFQYSITNVDTHSAKRRLYELPLENIQDTQLQRLYADVIQSYADKLDQVNTIGTQEFLYNSLRYYGEPSAKDIANAHFILHLPTEEEKEPQHDSRAIARFMQNFAQRNGYECEIQVLDGMLANALVSGSRVKINHAAYITTDELEALAHHEMGVHLLTTLNGRQQPLKVLSLGCPANTNTQEGLAILCEYLSGHFSIKRLRTLALRVLAVESMIKDRDFRHTFMLLKEQYKASDLQAFTTTARVYRGGGLTKDYLYLRGFREVLNAYDRLGDDFSLLLCGKTELKYFELIRSLVSKEIFTQPKFISPALSTPMQTNPIHRYIVSALK